MAEARQTNGARWGWAKATWAAIALLALAFGYEAVQREQNGKEIASLKTSVGFMVETLKEIKLDVAAIRNRGK